MTLSHCDKGPKNTRTLHILNLNIIVKNKKLPFNLFEDRESFIPKHYSQLQAKAQRSVRGAG